MYRALVTLRGADTNGNLQNAERLYYAFRNGRDFPKLSDYERTTGREPFS